MTGMAARTIILTDWQVADLRKEGAVAVIDCDERPVTIYVPGAIARPDFAGHPLLPLSAIDLHLIEQDPEGMVAADETGTTGWLVRVAS